MEFKEILKKKQLMTMQKATGAKPGGTPEIDPQDSHSGRGELTPAGYPLTLTCIL